MSPPLRLFRATALAALLVPVTAHAQSTRIDPSLARRLSLGESGLPGLPGDGLHGAGSQLDERLGLVVYTSNVAALRRAGVSVESTFDGFAVVRATPAQLPALLETPGVSRVALGEDEHLHNDVAAALVGARALRDGLLGDQAYTGAGAIVCAFDTGVDWKHLDFRSIADPTKSRILRYYDVTLTAIAGEHAPAGFTTGVEYTQADLNDELDGTPTGFVRSKDTNGHGTHTAGTAAGNGGSLTPRQHIGMAPDADLVVIKGGASSFTTADVLNGISYCDSVATAFGKPMVMNMSLGSDAGPHDGQDQKSAAIAQIVANPGRVVVQSAGNSGGSLIHRGGSLAPGDSVELSFTVPTLGTSANSGFGVDIWSQGRNLTLIAVSPNGTRFQQLAGGDNVYTNPTGQGNPYLYNWLVTGTDRWDGDLDRELYFTTTSTGTPRTAGGTWKIRLRNDDVVADTWHGWMFDGTIGNANSAVTLTGADAFYTVSNASPEAIAVGAYVHRWSWVNSGGTAYNYSGSNRTDLRASFSSQGPSRDGRVLPDISAPGQNMISARSSNAPASVPYDMAGGKHTGNQGTSMSAPVVAGSVALLLAAQPSLTYAQVKALLRDNANADSYVTAAGAVPNNEFGAGKLNVYQAMSRLVNPASTATVAVIQYDQTAGATLGDAALAAGTNAVLRFQSATSGRLRGLSFHTSDAAVPAGGFDVRVWTDAGGVPGTQVGPTINVPESVLQRSSWNYVNTDAITTNLTAATDYFATFTAVGGPGSLRHDGANSGRSYTAPDVAPLAERGVETPNGTQGVADIGVLTATGGDLLMRPVVSSDENAILPVELVAFEGAQNNRRAALTWLTASETNNVGWGVEKMGANAAEWTEVGFVRGVGTTTETQRYGFETGTLLPGAHTFRLRQVDTDGAVHYSGLVTVEIGVDRALALLPAGPNPFSAQTTLLLTVPTDGAARATLYDVLGRRVQTLFEGATVAGAAQTLVVDGSALAPGTYLVRAEAGGRTVQRTLVVAR